MPDRPILMFRTFPKLTLTRSETINRHKGRFRTYRFTYNGYDIEVEKFERTFVRVETDERIHIVERNIYTDGKNYYVVWKGKLKMVYKPLVQYTLRAEGEQHGTILAYGNYL